MERDTERKTNGRPHFSVGRMCAGCPMSVKLHEGCVINQNVRVINTNGSGTQPPEAEVTSNAKISV